MWWTTKWSEKWNVGWKRQLHIFLTYGSVCGTGEPAVVLMWEMATESWDEKRFHDTYKKMRSERSGTFVLGRELEIMMWNWNGNEVNEIEMDLTCGFPLLMQNEISLTFLFQPIWLPNAELNICKWGVIQIVVRFTT